MAFLCLGWDSVLAKIRPNPSSSSFGIFRGRKIIFLVAESKKLKE
jgi:hypothetical protein